MKRFLAAAFVLLCALTAAYAQNAITLPFAAQAVADIGNGPIKVRVTQGNAAIFTAQGSATALTLGSSTALTLGAVPLTAPLVGGLISGPGITSGTTVAAYDGVTNLTLSAAMSVPGGSTVAWGAACPSSAAGIPSQYIQAIVQADYYLLYTQARVCAISPGGAANTLLILPIFYDNTVAGSVTSVFGRPGAVVAQAGDYNFSQISGTLGCSQLPGLTGDVTTTNCAAVLATVNANVGSFGSATQCTAITVNAKGLITAASVSTCTPAFSSLTGNWTLAQGPSIAANTVLSNWTAGSTIPTANTWPACASDGSHGLTYVNGTGLQCTVITSGSGGAGTVTSITLGAGLSSGAASQSITGSGTAYSITAPQGRLTLVSGTPVMHSVQTAKSVVYYDCYVGDVVPYYNGTADAADTISSCEVSMTMVAAASTGQVTTAGVFDIWWVHSGANRICVATSAGGGGGGGGWASDTGGSNTARGTGFSQLDTTSRPYITNKNAIPHCYNGATDYGSVSANQATYLGTLYSTAAGQTGMNYLATGAGGGNPILGLYNGYNRVRVACQNSDTNYSWTYASITIRIQDNSSNNRCSFVDGLQQSTISVNYMDTAQNDAVIAFGADSTTVADFGTYNTAGNNVFFYNVVGSYTPKIGFHFVQAMEAVSGGGTTTTFYGGTVSGVGEVNLLRVELDM